LLSDQELLTAHSMGGLRRVAIAAVAEYMSTLPGEDGMYVHVVVPLTKENRGPATDPGEFDHWGCWCGDQECLVGKYGKRPEWLLERGMPDALG
jgi:hypothetical protein